MSILKVLSYRICEAYLDFLGWRKKRRMRRFEKTNDNDWSSDVETEICAGCREEVPLDDMSAVTPGFCVDCSREMELVRAARTLSKKFEG
jgi:hypothetical protein